MAYGARPVPQNIMSVEFKIFDFMTLKQFGISVGLMLVCFALYFVLGAPWGIVISLFIIVIGGIVIFVPFNGEPFQEFLSSYMEAMISPQRRVWHKKGIVVKSAAEKARFYRYGNDPIPETENKFKFADQNNIKITQEQNQLDSAEQQFLQSQQTQQNQVQQSNQQQMPQNNSGTNISQKSVKNGINLSKFIPNFGKQNAPTPPVNPATIPAQPQNPIPQYNLNQYLAPQQNNSQQVAPQQNSQNPNSQMQQNQSSNHNFSQNQQSTQPNQYQPIQVSQVNSQQNNPQQAASQNPIPTAQTPFNNNQNNFSQNPVSQNSLSSSQNQFIPVNLQPQTPSQNAQQIPAENPGLPTFLKKEETVTPEQTNVFATPKPQQNQPISQDNNQNNSQSNNNNSILVPPTHISPKISQLDEDDETAVKNYIFGSVESYEDKPVKGAAVILKTPDGIKNLEVINTNDAGEFKTNYEYKAGQYKIYVNADGKDFNEVLIVNEPVDPVPFTIRPKDYDQKKKQIAATQVEEDATNQEISNGIFEGAYDANMFNLGTDYLDQSSVNSVQSTDNLQTNTQPAAPSEQDNKLTSQQGNDTTISDSPIPAAGTNTYHAAYSDQANNMFDQMMGGRVTNDYLEPEPTSLEDIATNKSTDTNLQSTNNNVQPQNPQLVTNSSVQVDLQTSKQADNSSQSSSQANNPISNDVEIFPYEDMTNANVPFENNLVTLANTINGILVGPNGSGLDNTQIRILDLQNQLITSMNSDQTGRFYSYSPLPNGTYIIYLSKNNQNLVGFKVSLSGKVIPPKYISFSY